MTPFEEWYESRKLSVQTNVWANVEQEYGRDVCAVDQESVKDVLKEAYEAGWNSCRDEWGGLTYSETNSPG